MKHKVGVTFQTSGQTVKVTPGQTILEAARLAEISLAAPCGGNGRCGKCLVELSNQGEATGKVLACQTQVFEDLTVVVPEQQLIILEAGQAAPVQLEPAIFINPQGAVEHREFLSPATAGPADPLLGVALDLGTTTLVAYLYDLVNGQQLAVASAKNGQLTYGADVISRLAYALRGDQNYSKLHQAVLKSLQQLLSSCAAMAKVELSQVRELVIVGNTPMIHLLLQLPVEKLAAAPFQPHAKGPFYLTAQELGLGLVPNAVCYLPPSIGGFVGSDALAAALAQGFGSSTDKVLLVDIGTNGEIMLQAAGKIYAASAPAGPALEGGNIECGMIAEPGAISRVQMDFAIHPEVIGNQQPRGICGSGLVDAVSEMLRLGILDCSGRLLAPTELPPITSFKIKQLLLKETTGNKIRLTANVYISQKDIRELQLAKAAVAAGIELVMTESGLSAEGLDSILLAGGFGNYLSPANALRIGLMGKQPLSKLRQVGNAAGAGAIMLLLSYPARKQTEELCQRIAHLELASDPRYQTVFMQQINFPKGELGI